ncbi:MAG: lysostaphin resistance A-like protein [Nitrospiraceae bacterium]
MDHELLSILTYAFLGASLLSLWVKKHWGIWSSLLGLAAVFGLASSRIDWVGVSELTGLGALVYVYYRRQLPSTWRSIVGLLIVAASLALFSHQVPGFSNWKIVSGHQFSADAIPYSMSLNWDKPMVGLLILAFGLDLIRSTSEWRYLVRSLIPLLTVGGALVLLASFAFGYVRVDVKLPDITLIWALKNLLFTCMAEEALFRGFIQKEVTTLLSGLRWGRTAGLLLASALFGLAHFLGGVKYVLLASLAGVFYGLVYLKTNRIEASILFHFGLNLVHFLAFSYPALQAAF